MSTYIKGSIGVADNRDRMGGGDTGQVVQSGDETRGGSRQDPSDVASWVKTGQGMSSKLLGSRC